MDFPNEMTVNVTQDDIDTGVSGDACNCPIANATNRHLLKENKGFSALAGGGNMLLIYSQNNTLAASYKCTDSEFNQSYFTYVFDTKKRSNSKPIALTYKLVK